MRAGRRLHGFLGGDHAAFAENIETEFAGGAHHKRAADRNGNRLAGVAGLPPRLAGMHAGKNDRRPAGIGGRGDPCVDAEIRRQHHALPIERRGDALPMFAAGGDEGGDASDQHQAAQRVRIAPGDPRRRPAHLEGARRGERALEMGLPQRQRIRILRRDGELVDDRRRRAMAKAAAAIEPAQAIGRSGHAQAGKPEGCRYSGDRKQEHDRGTAGRRQPEKQPEP